MIKTIYSVFLGLLISIFIGVGVSVFYPEPEWPEEPRGIPCWEYEESYDLEEPDGLADLTELTDEQKAECDAFFVAQDEYDEAMKDYNRNTSIVVLVCAVILLGVGLSMGKHMEVMANGLLLGGAFTLFYGMMRGLATDSDAYRFGVISVCLAVVAGLGYQKFVRPQQKKEE